MAKEANSATAVSDPQSKQGFSVWLLIIPVLNTLALVGTLGVLYYSKLKYKRVPIMEDGERARLAKVSEAPVGEEMKGSVDFEPVTVNIASYPEQPKAADGKSQQIQGKLHYATVGFVLEIGDKNLQSHVNAVRPLILDRLILLLGKKTSHELSTVQGRYVLSTEIIDFANSIIASAPHASAKLKDGLITHVYFTQFLVQ